MARKRAKLANEDTRSCNKKNHKKKQTWSSFFLRVVISTEKNFNSFSRNIYQKV